MSKKEIINILESHSIPYYIKNNQIYVDSMLVHTKIFEHVENITRWSKKRLYNWLGY